MPMLCVLLLLLAQNPPSIARSSQHGPLKAIRAGRIIPSAETEPIQQGLVVVEGERIVRVSPAEAVPPGAEVIDLGRLTLIPGLVDAHSHLTLDVLAGNEAEQVRAPDIELALRAARHAGRDLRSGVTTMRVLSEPNFIDIAYRKFFNAGELPGPSVLVATRAIAPTNGHGVTSARADGADEVRKVTRVNLKAGADWIKLYVTGGIATPGSSPLTSYYSRDELQAAVEEARRAGRRVAAHAYGGEGADYCISAGVNSIEHGLYLSDEQFSAMASRGIWLGATLGVFLRVPGPAENPSWPAEVREKFLAARRAALESLRRARKAGVKIVLGTDASHGNLWEEAQFAAQAGLSPREVLRALTRSGAELNGLEAEMGTLEVGKRADIVGVEGNPLEDVSSLRRVRFVMKGGRVYPALER